MFSKDYIEFQRIINIVITKFIILRDVFSCMKIRVNNVQSSVETTSYQQVLHVFGEFFLTLFKLQSANLHHGFVWPWHSKYLSVESIESKQNRQLHISHS